MAGRFFRGHHDHYRFLPLYAFAGASRDLYDHLYCARGEMEIRIKEQQC